MIAETEPNPHLNGAIMTGPQSDPSSLVKVELNFGEPTYLRLAARLYGEDTEEWWKDLGDLLYGRPGWYCEITSTPEMELIWSYGAVGSSLFNISYDDEPGYALFDWEADSTRKFQTVDELRKWLNENEWRHADHALKLRDLASSSDWAVLKAVGFDIDVTFDNDRWIGTVRKLPVTMSAGMSLADVVSQMREGIAQAFDAPASVAKDLQVRVHLDPASAAALTS